MARYGISYRWWVVVDATPESQIEDILFQTNLEGLANQFKGGLSTAQHPTLYTDQAEARADAEKRLAAMETYQEVLGEIRGDSDSENFLCVVVDPIDETEWTDIAVICESEAEARVIAGKQAGRNPSIYTDAAEAETEAKRRLATRRSDDEKA